MPNLPDAIQIGTALATGADAFLTNEKTLKRIREIDVLVLGDLVRKARQQDRAPA